MFKNLFRSKKTEPEPLVFDTNYVNQKSIENLETDFLETPDWLKDEPSLKDEAVIYGFTGTELNKKIAIIEGHFDKKAIKFKKKIAELDEKTLELNLELEEKDKLKTELNIKTNEVEKGEVKSSNFLRSILGTLLSLSMCLANYFLLQFWFKPILTNYTDLISLAIYLAGMFNLFQHISIFHLKQDSDWRAWLEAFTMPMVASLLIFGLSYTEYGILKSILVGVYFLGNFLFTGKLLLAFSSVLPEYSDSFFKKLKNAKNAKHAWPEKVKNLEEEINQIRKNKWKLKPDLEEAEAQLQILLIEKQHFIEVFSSEYALAKNYFESKTLKK